MPWRPIRARYPWTLRVYFPVLSNLGVDRGFGSQSPEGFHIIPEKEVDYFRWVLDGGELLLEPIPVDKSTLTASDP